MKYATDNNQLLAYIIYNECMVQKHVELCFFVLDEGDPLEVIVPMEYFFSMVTNSWSINTMDNLTHEADGTYSQRIMLEKRKTLDIA